MTQTDRFTCAHCGHQADEAAVRCPRCGKKSRRHFGRKLLRLSVTRWPRRAITAPVVIVVALLVAFFVLVAVADESVEVRASRLSGISASAYAQLKMGDRRSAIEKMFGKGANAFDWEAEGPATEPMDASCAYHLLGNTPTTAQLCFREGRLVRKTMVAP